MADFFGDMVPPQTPLPIPDPFGRAQGVLNRGDNLFSRTRAFRLSMRFDGNLALHVIDDRDLPPDITQGQYLTLLWTSNTLGSGFTCEMQNDGNLVVYNEARGPVFATNTQNNNGAFLRCQDDGNLVVYSAQGVALFDTSTFAGPR
jgi:hypothetical protein